MDAGMLVTQVTEVAAINPSAKAIVAQVEDPELACAAQEVFGMMLKEGTLPPVFIFSGELGLADRRAKGASLGIYLGLSELAKLMALDGEQIKAALTKLIVES